MRKSAVGVLLASALLAVSSSGGQSGVVPAPGAGEFLINFEHQKWKKVYPLEYFVTDLKVGVEEFGLDDHRLVFEGQSDDAFGFAQIQRADEGDFEVTLVGSIEGVSAPGPSPFFGIEVDWLGTVPLQFRFLGVSREESINGAQAFGNTTGGAPIGTPALFPGVTGPMELQLQRVGFTVTGRVRPEGVLDWTDVFATTVGTGPVGFGFGGANIAEGQAIAIKKLKATGAVPGAVERALISQIEDEALAREIEAHAALSLAPPDTATALAKVEEAITDIGESISAIDTASEGGTLQETTNAKKAVRNLDKARKTDIRVREALDGIGTPADPAVIDALKSSLEDAIRHKQFAILLLKGFEVKKQADLDKFLVDC